MRLSVSFGIRMFQIRGIQEDRSTALREVTPPAEFIASLTQLVLRQFPIVLFVTLLTTALGIAYLLTKPPSFIAQATLIIEPRKVQPFEQSSVTGDSAIESSIVASQVEILKSEKIALAVI